MEISKSEFKARALEVFRGIEQSGETTIITDRGTPKLEIRKIRRLEVSPRQLLKGSVIRYDLATAPVAVEDWDSA